MPRFVILEHDHPFLHWDFLLEEADALKTWRLHRPPDSPGIIPAEQLPDHRLTYLNYEGSISDNRGDVQRWDQGEYRIRQMTDSNIEIELQGSRLIGHAVLTRIASGRKESRNDSINVDWEFTFQEDPMTTG
ncbi:MAG: hypothetical protein IID45_07705 [Planctomycetes bacterium]|nr:hypothetical protein [Planctomycetota bacterium]